VWEALTTAEGWTSWFSQGVTGEFSVGNMLTLEFGKNCICYAIVDELTPETVFAYRWHPGEDCSADKYPLDEMTTVRFELQDHAEGTWLTLMESGFENIPESRRAWCFGQNSEGWDQELPKLVAWAEEGKIPERTSP
jgi:uncharacterized protein YndB with AHSA1/START domain